MKLVMMFGTCLTCAALSATAAQKAAGCNREGDAQFICGPRNAEDFAPLPQSPWVIASGMGAPGGLHLIDSRDYSWSILFPAESARQRPDTTTYPSCPGPIGPQAQFGGHGLNLRAGANGVHTLYVVGHGSREAVEVFEVDARGPRPILTWIGCAIAPETVGLNSVAALPDGGFAATNFLSRGDPNVRAKVFAGEVTGKLWEWHPRVGWQRVPGSEFSGPNGLEVSTDGKWFYIAGWGSQTFIRLSRGQTPVKKDAVATPFRIDNLRWAPDGALYAAGQGGSAQAILGDCLGQERKCSEVTANVARIDPNTLKVEQLIRYPANDVFIVGTAAIAVGKEIWLGTARGDRIARFPEAIAQ